jgi:hypothetical protein
MDCIRGGGESGIARSVRERIYETKRIYNEMYDECMDACVHLSKKNFEISNMELP